MGIMRILAGVGGAAIAAGLASAAYQTAASRRDRRRFPPPGRMVDIGGRRIHLWCAGTGTPTVVIVPSLGAASLDFAALLPTLAKETSVVVFDRAGLGWSDPNPGPPALLNAADDLHQALRQSGISPPFILVGHSIGGYIVRLYAAQHPEEVAGVVLLDSSHHDQIARFPSYRVQIPQRILADRLVMYGVRRLAGDLGMRDNRQAIAGRGYPAEYLNAGVALELNDRQRRADLWELASWSRIAAKVREHAPSLGSIPLTVVSSSELSSDYRTPKQIADRHKMYNVWYPMQCELAQLSTDSRHVVAEDAGHFVHRHDPGLVVDAILDQVRRARVVTGTVTTRPTLP